MLIGGKCIYIYTVPYCIHPFLIFPILYPYPYLSPSPYPYFSSALCPRLPIRFPSGEETETGRFFFFLHFLPHFGIALSYLRGRKGEGAEEGGEFGVWISCWTVRFKESRRSCNLRSPVRIVLYTWVLEQEVVHWKMESFHVYSDSWVTDAI